MANSPNDYRDPKVTAAPAKKSMSDYLPWIIAALIALALLAWFLGAFSSDDAEVATNPTSETVVEQPVVVDPVTPVDPVAPVQPSN